jgi:NDP-sugar pyrophosphorylase family protein
MKAIVMAGGKGSRLHPYSATLPKPLMPLGDMPVLELLLHQLRRAGVDEVILAVNHLRHLIEAFFGDGSRFGIPIRYSLEDTPLGTAGPMGAVLDQLGEHFLLLNGDLLTSFDFEEMMRAHLAAKSDVMIGVFERELTVDYREKPSSKQLVSMGIYAIRAAAVRGFVNPGQRLDMPQLVLAMTRAGRDVRCHRQDCVWLDIGRPEDFARAQKMIETGMDVFLPKRQQ